MNRSVRSAALASRAAMAFLIAAASAVGQAPAGKAPPRPQAAKPPAAKPVPDAGTAPATANSAPTPKGFSRLAVTPDVKQQFEGDMRYAVIAAPNYAGSELNALRFTVADTLELKGELDRQGYLVRLISPPEPTTQPPPPALPASPQLL